MPSRLNWCPEEENFLKTLKEEENICSWKKIAQILNQKFIDSSRSGKQCRDRYINYVRFNLKCPKIVGWTSEEDQVLFQKFQQYGAKWVLISSEMPGRSENNLKNRFYGAMRKIMRKIVKVEKELKPKPKKSIKEKQLIKVFEECRNSQDVENIPVQIEDFQQFSNKLYQKLLVLAISQEEQISHEEVKTAIAMIHMYNNASSKCLTKLKNQSISSVTGFMTKDSIINQSEIESHSEQEKAQSVSTQQNLCEQTNQDSCLQWQPCTKNQIFSEQNDFDFWSFENNVLGDLNADVDYEILPEASSFYF